MSILFSALPLLSIDSWSIPLLIIVAFVGGGILLQYTFRKQLPDELQNMGKMENSHIFQLNREIRYSIFTGLIQGGTIHVLSYILMKTSYDLRMVKMYGWIFGFSQPFLLNFGYYLLYLNQQNEYLKKETQSFQQLSKVTEKKTLQDLVSPHFLFNSLNTVASITLDEPKKAVEFVKKLSDLYDFILQNNENQLIELKEEVEIVEKYCFLIQTRFGENFQMELNIPTRYYHSLIPPLALQNLVENAAKHNAVTKKRPLRLTIGVHRDFITIVNNINPKNTFQNESTNLGLNYVRTQFEQFTNKKISIEKSDNQFKVHIPIIYPGDI